MGYYQVEGVALRLRPIGEADAFVTLFTRERGKLDLKARGVRRPQSKLVALVQPFCHARILVYKGKTVDGVAQGEVLASFRELREDLDRLSYASYFAELVDAFTAPEEPVPPAFTLLVQAIHSLAWEPSTKVLLAFRHAFEIRLVSILGYEPQLNLCVGCAKEAAAPERWHFSIAQGGLLCETCLARDSGAVSISPRVLAALRYLATARWERVGLLSLPSETWRQLDNLLTHYIDYRVERKLPAREFLGAIREEVSNNGRGPDHPAGED